MARRRLLPSKKWLTCCVRLLACAFLLGGPSNVATADEREYPIVEGMMLIPAGEFIMGSGPDDRHAEDDEKPQRKVYLPAYYIDQFEVSNIEYKRFLDATGHEPPESWRNGVYPEDADWYPVHEVSWWEAKAYAKWVGKRLPTEAEWEKAARGVDGRRFPWGDEFVEEYANAGKEGYAPINSGLEGASPYGVVNMAGNVAEWTESVYKPYPHLDVELPSEFGGGKSATSSPVSEDEEPFLGNKTIYPDDPRLQFFKAAELQDTRDRVYRGGSLNSFTQFLRTANRQHASPNSRWYNIGFRCAKDAVPADEILKQSKGN